MQTLIATRRLEARLYEPHAQRRVPPVVPPSEVVIASHPQAELDPADDAGMAMEPPPGSSRLTSGLEGEPMSGGVFVGPTASA